MRSARLIPITSAPCIWRGVVFATPRLALLVWLLPFSSARFFRQALEASSPTLAFFTFLRTTFVHSLCGRLSPRLLSFSFSFIISIQGAIDVRTDLQIEEGGLNHLPSQHPLPPNLSSVQPGHGDLFMAVLPDLGLQLLETIKERFIARYAVSLSLVY